MSIASALLIMVVPILSPFVVDLAAHPKYRRNTSGNTLIGQSNAKTAPYGQVPKRDE
jgi:hypothetical protein